MRLAIYESTGQDKYRNQIIANINYDQNTRVRTEQSQRKTFPDEIVPNCKIFPDKTVPDKTVPDKIVPNKKLKQL